MDDALHIFRERGFDLLIAEAQIAAAGGDATAAGAFANPLLSASAGRSFDYDPRACPGCSATAWSIGLTDPSALSDLISGKRGLRIEVARAALAAAKRSRDDALRTLSLQVRQAVLDPAFFDRALPEAGPALDLLAREALESRPDLLAASAQAARAEAALALARRQRVPDVALSAQYAQEGSGQNALQPPTLVFGAQL